MTRVAIVGNAQGVLADDGVIDDYDLVVRINHGFILPSYKTSRGSKTDIVMTSSEDFIEKAVLAGGKVIWLTSKRRDEIARRWGDRLEFFPEDWWASLQAKIGSRPSSGMMAIEYFVNKRMPHIDLYGFNFYKTPNWYGGHQGRNCPHDFSKEEELVISYQEKGYLKVLPVKSDKDISVLPLTLAFWRLKKRMHTLYFLIKKSVF